MKMPIGKFLSTNQSTSAMEKDQDKSFVATAQLQLLDKTGYKTHAFNAWYNYLDLHILHLP